MKIWLKVFIILIFGIISTLLIRSQIKPCSWMDVAVQYTGCLHTLHQDISPVESVAFSPDGTFLAATSQDGTVRLWQTADWRLGPAKRIAFPRDSRYSCDLAFSPDGSLIAVGSPNGTVWIWRADDGKLVQVLKGHSAKICDLAFSLNGNILASAS